MKKLLLLGAAVLLFFTACSKKNSAKQAYGMNSSAKLATRASDVVMADAAYFDDFEYEMGEESLESPALQQAQGLQNSEGLQEKFEQKLIRTGNVSLEVQTVSNAEEEITNWAKSPAGRLGENG